MANSTPRRRRKPAKPHDDFPLFPHATKRWAKKIRGKTRYFGKVTDDGDFGASKALDVYRRQADDLHSGREPQEAERGLTVAKLINTFLSAKKRAVAAGEITERTFRDYGWTLRRVHDTLGPTRLVANLRPADFAKLSAAMARTLAAAGRGTEIRKTRCMFNFAFANELIDRPVRYGSEFAAPSEKVLKRNRREARQTNGKKMFSAAEIRQMLEAATPALKAMVLLGINAGFGNHDCGSLPIAALDLDGDWVEHARPKTGEPRRCPLWPETIEALRESLRTRPEPAEAEYGDRVFLTRLGHPWVRQTAFAWQDNVGVATNVLLGKLGIKRPGCSFYALRHTFATIAGETTDQVAVNAIMGHADGSMAAVYRESISDERLVAVSNHVRAWLFDSSENG